MSRDILFLFRLFIFVSCIFQVFGQLSSDLPGKLRRSIICLFKLNKFFYFLEGWGIAGDSPNNYQMGTDSTVFHSAAVGIFDFN